MAAAPENSAVEASVVPQALVDNRVAGIALLKPQYILKNEPAPPVIDDDAAEQKTDHIEPSSSDVRDKRVDDRDSSSSKRQRTDERGSFASTRGGRGTGAGGQKQTKEERKARQGQNKGRKFAFGADESSVCWAFASGKVCHRGDHCKMSHDIEGYLRVKPHDIHLETHPKLNPNPPYVEATTSTGSSTSTRKSTSTDTTVTDGIDSIIYINATAEPTNLPSTSQSFDRTTHCPRFAADGSCNQGWKCRFLGAHIERATEEEVLRAKSTQEAFDTDHSIPPTVVDGWKLRVVDVQKGQLDALGQPKREEEVNHQDGDTLRNLRTRNFPYPLATAYLNKLDPAIAKDLYRGKEEKKSAIASESVLNEPIAEDEEEAMMNEMMTASTSNSTHDGGVLASLAGAEVDGDDVKMRVAEKRSLDWRGKTYCAPLTTVGNLPFRRLVVDYGADITCGEMALAQSLVMGSQDEWALTQRHASERTFGVQICGGKPGFMVPAAEAISKLCAGNVDFVDVNLGCPIDLVVQKGAGSALFDAPGRLGNILKGMNEVLGDIPLTVKFRTGITKTKNIAHKMIPRFAGEWGVSAMTLHGRSRQQRYAKLADWNYIRECADVLRASCTDAGIPAPPIFGNGDCFSAQSYYDEMENSGVDGVMVARGALIKPWIFTEIKEKREWDISATERLEGLRKYAEFGLSHWGTDTRGVNTTRRFLCEAQSFQHRYIPIGLLERMPPQMNERPPAYRGRNELETLLASGNSEDWVKISEMFLGKRSDDFHFLPKHKSNAYGTANEEGNG